MDTTVKACTNFFQFANGGWLKRDTIPADYSTSGVAKDMTDQNELVVRSVLDDAMAHHGDASASSTERKLGTFYATCMDSTAAEGSGIDPIRPLLDSIAAIRTRADMLRRVAALHEIGVYPLFSYFPRVDPHDSRHYVAAIGRSGLGMPDRDYYTDSGHVADSLRGQYLAHITRTLVLAGETSVAAGADAAHIMAIETRFARTMLTRVALREPSATDHPTKLTALQQLAPAVNWRSYFRQAGLANVPEHLNVSEPRFLRRMNELLVTVPLSEWKAYLRYHTIASSARWLSTPFVQEDFAYSSLFSGATQLLPRWKRCLQETDGDIGEALGQAYVARTFPPEAKARATQLIDDVRTAFHERLLHLAWMSDSTRNQALAKLAQMREKVGYPDKWRDYSALTVEDGPFAINVLRANQFEWARVASRPGMPVDTTEWAITVPTVNAYNDQTKNEMVFPAGALEPQTFDMHADDGANYGALAGSWAGHELTHGFDDQGRHYDSRGNLRDWWTTGDSARFTQQAEVMVRQFDGYTQVDTLHVNGQLTLGENIADLGGVLTGYDAFERAVARDGRPGLIDGFTPEQRFFIAYAQTFRSHDRPESLRLRQKVDPHSPDPLRTNGPLSNVPAFARAFGCKPGDPMVRDSAGVPHIW